MEGTGEVSSGGADQSGDLRQVAVSVGDLHGELALRIAPLVTASSEERIRLATEGLRELHSNDLLAESEAQRLSDLVRSLSGKDASPDELAELADNALQEFQAAAHANPAALAIASVVAERSRAAARMFGGLRSPDGDEVARDIGDFSTAAECACAGGIVGATAGALFGPAGVLAGAAAGAVGGAVGFAVAQALLSD